MRVLLLISLLAFSACDGDDDDVGPIEQAMTIQSITLVGTTTEAATTTVDQQPDEDGIVDTHWSATFSLQDGIGPSIVPVDDGTARTHTFDVKSVPEGAGEVGRTRVQIAIGSE